uniref:Uncharacterized protein n=1 Tax=Tetraselmis sp. GSL018 TaxID=582737 RepID=A0A061QQQ0_9CHLO|mmetsp:Transcript_8802/g.21265  ORF Transcript_8802/g.21265 Transcript_8802/m.21265 type:complete len:289 (-) Transcript_8802:224-1090(-)
MMEHNLAGGLTAHTGSAPYSPPSVPRVGLLCGAFPKFYRRKSVCSFRKRSLKIQNRPINRVGCAVAVGGQQDLHDEQPSPTPFPAPEQENTELSPEYVAWLQSMKQQSDESYATLKSALLMRTRRSGTLLTLYIFLVVSSPAAFCTMVGAATSYLYMLLLMADVDSRSVRDTNLIMEAEREDNRVRRLMLRAVGAYVEALRPRLLLPVALAAGAWYYNEASGSSIGVTEEGCLFLGFCSYKLGLIVELWESVKPRPKSRDELMRQERPMLRQLEDVEDVRPDLKDERL